jgi:hypothetical protein
MLNGAHPTSRLIMDKISEVLRAIAWKYAPQDPAACDQLSERIADVGKRRSLITYSDLARGVQFTLPSLKEPKHSIDVRDWQDLDRAIVGDFLGYLSMKSYDEAGFFTSALVVSKEDGSPVKASMLS